MPKSTTQDFLEFDKIKEGVIILKNKGMRGILLVSSLNLALKSDEEEKAIISAFQDFLNSLDFFVQIVVQSRRLNLTGYLDKVKGLSETQADELLRLQTKNYYDFIQSLVERGTIMTKNFYVVVPFNPLEALIKKGGILKKPKILTLTEEEFQRAKFQLWQRMEFVALGLRRCELRAIPLTSGEIIEFLWQLNHPKDAEIGYYPEIPPELQ